VDFTEWSKLALICILGAMSPGPSLAVILRNSISGSRKQGVFAGIGHGLGITFYALTAVLGLVTFIENIPNFFIISQIIGSLFLIWVGSKMIISLKFNKSPLNEGYDNKITGKKGFVEGFLIAFLNPKIAAWTFALFSQFIKPYASINEQIILISTVGGIDAIWYCFIATLTTSKRLVKTLNQNSKIIDLVMGILLILLALGMLWEIKTQY